MWKNVLEVCNVIFHVDQKGTSLLFFHNLFASFGEGKTYCYHSLKIR